MTKTIIQEANNIVRLQHVEETNKSLKYLNDELKNTMEIGTKDSISTLIDAQLKVKMIANVRERESILKCLVECKTLMLRGVVTPIKN